MHAENVTTPFGRRPMTLALLKGQMNAATRKSETVDKWKIFRDICEARELLGVNDRALSVLNALISFYPHAELDASKNLVVFPSNAQLTLRAHGITGTTLRRHIVSLVECGLILRKDSPNGKRYAHRGKNGSVEEAYGFSLAPLLAGAEDFDAKARQVQDDRKAHRLAKERLSICRRDIRKLIAAAVAERAPGDWSLREASLDEILAQLPRSPSVSHILAATRACERLRVEIINHLETQLNPEILDGNDHQIGCHLQNTKPYTNLEKDETNEITEAAEIIVSSNTEASKPVSLHLVLKACSQMADYAPSGVIAGWNDMTYAATVVRKMLGINDATYAAACQSMGRQDAAASVAYILERGTVINSAGAYLRDMMRRAGRGALPLESMLQAMLRSNLQASVGQ